MNENHKRPSAEELAELIAYLEARQHGVKLSPGDPGYPRGLSGELLKLADATLPDPEFAARLELQLQTAARESKHGVRPGWLSALWHSISQPERKTTMKRVMIFALVGTLLIAVMWVTLPLITPRPTQTQIALVNPPTQTPLPTSLSPLTPTAIMPTSLPPVAINFTPQPAPAQPPVLPALVDALGEGYGGSGAGNLPEGLPLSLAVDLPTGPGSIGAYYRMESTPLTLEEASRIAAQWGLEATLYTPAWMQSVTPDQTERFYIAVDGMQNLSMLNSDLSFTDLSIFPSYGGHQYPQSGLPPAEQAVEISRQYLEERGYLDYPYQIDLSNYDYGLVSFYRLLDKIPVTFHTTSIKIDPQGLVGSAWVNREEYQSVGTYPLISSQSAWDMLTSREHNDQISISYHSTQDGNPQYWGRVYPSGQTANLFGAPTYLPAAEPGGAPYIQLNNLILAGDASGMLEYLRGNQGYIHAWGEVQDIDGTRQLKLAGWEPFDEFSGYFDGTVRRSAEGNYLELSDGRRLALPDLPGDVPADIPLYAQGGLVGDTLEWFILQVHPATEGQAPPDLSQAQAVIDKVELVYLEPSYSGFPPDKSLDPAYRMLIPVWRFSGTITQAGGADLTYTAYVQAATNP